MIYIALKDNKIVHSCETNSEDKVIASMQYEGITDYDSIQQIPNEYFTGKVGQDIREFDSKYELLSLSERKDFVDIPEGKKIEGNEFVEMTIKEKIDAGLTVLSDREKYDDITKTIIQKTNSELATDGILAIEEFKIIKYQEISDAYNQHFINGHFPSEVLGINIDYRRNTTKNDLQNVDVLIEFMTDSEIAETEYKGYQNQKTMATLAQIKLMRKEMIAYSIYLYGKKEALELSIDNAQTIEALNSIIW